MSIENGQELWKAQHVIVEREPVNEEFRLYYGELVALGIIRGQPFKPNARVKKILDRTAKLANAQLRVQSLADRRTNRLAWPGRQ